MSKYCECGHTLAEHAGEDQGTTCLALDFCECECFKEASTVSLIEDES